MSCNLSEGIRESASKARAIINLETIMKKTNMTLEEAMDFLDYSEKEKEEIREIIKEKDGQ